MGWMAWDLMRGVDLLLARQGIDPERIILLGAVAGGGDPAAVTAALDRRIACCVPFNFGGPQPETRYPLPDDAETRFNYLGSSYWDSSRGLRLGGRDGFLPWVIVASIAPRRLVHAHEFSWDGDARPGLEALPEGVGRVLRRRGRPRRGPRQGTAERPAARGVPLQQHRLVPPRHDPPAFGQVVRHQGRGEGRIPRPPQVGGTDLPDRRGPPRVEAEGAERIDGRGSAKSGSRPPASGRPARRPPSAAKSSATTGASSSAPSRRPSRPSSSRRRRTTRRSPGPMSSGSCWKSSRASRCRSSSSCPPG